MVEVAPEIELQLTPRLVETRHCTLGVRIPVAEALNEAVSPAVTVSLIGCEVIERVVRAVVRPTPDRAGTEACWGNPTTRSVSINCGWCNDVAPATSGAAKAVPRMRAPTRSPVRRNKRTTFVWLWLMAF